MCLRVSRGLPVSLRPGGGPLSPDPVLGGSSVWKPISPRSGVPSFRALPVQEVFFYFPACGSVSGLEHFSCSPGCSQGGVEASPRLLLSFVPQAAGQSPARA